MIILRIPKQSFSEGDFLFLEFRFSLFYRLIIQIYAFHHEDSYRISISKLLVCYISDSTLIGCTHFSCTLETIVGFPFHLLYQFHISTIFEGFLLDDHCLSLHSLLTKKSWIIFSRSTIKKEGEGERGKKEERRIDKWSENSLVRFISKPVSLLSAPVFRVGWCAVWRFYIGRKKIRRIYLPSSISNTMSSISKLKGREKKWRTSGTIDFLLLNFVFVGTLKLNFLSLFIIFVSFFSKCDFIWLFIIIYSIYYMILKRLVKIILLILILEINNLRIQGISLYWITLIIVREGIQLM